MNRKIYFSLAVIGLMLIVVFTSACATPTPTPQPTPTIESITKEIVPFLCQPSITGEYRSNVVARTRGDAIVQVWYCNQQFTEISADAWKSTEVEPNMAENRACFGDWSINTTVRFEIQSATQTTARLCKSGIHSLICIEQKLSKASNQWSVSSQKQVFNARNGCPPPDLSTTITSPTSGPPTPVPRITLTSPFTTRAARHVIVSDTFDQDSNRWIVGNLSEPFSAGNRAISNGKYRWSLRANAPALGYALPNDIAPVNDFEATVEGQRISETKNVTYGLIFRYVDDQNFYVFRISEDGYFVFQIQSNGTLNTWGSWFKTDAIQSGGINQLTIIAQGARFTFAVNGKIVREVVDDKFPRGRVGIAVGTSGLGDESVVEFDRFEIVAPQ